MIFLKIYDDAGRQLAIALLSRVLFVGTHPITSDIWRCCVTALLRYYVIVVVITWCNIEQKTHTNKHKNTRTIWYRSWRQINTNFYCAVLHKSAVLRLWAVSCCSWYLNKTVDNHWVSTCLYHVGYWTNGTTWHQPSIIYITTKCHYLWDSY